MREMEKACENGYLRRLERPFSHETGYLLDSTTVISTASHCPHIKVSTIYKM